VIVDVGGNAACHESPTTFPPCAASGTRPGAPVNSTPIVFAPQATSPASVSTLENSFAPYMTANDTVMLSSGAPDPNDPPNVGLLNSDLAQLESSLPAGIHFEARTAGLSNVGWLVSNGISHGFDGLIYDYEPNFEPEFTDNFSATLSNFQSFATLCHAAGFDAFGYPYSQPVWVGSDRSLGWNFGELAATTGVNDLQIQLQGAAHVSATTWQNSLTELVAQYAGYGLPASAITVQLTLAVGDPNQISVASAYADYQSAVAHGVGAVILWWNAESVPEMVQLLGLVR
jgi:hypothetical protein